MLVNRGIIERQTAVADHRVKILALTPEGERPRDHFWHDLVTDVGPLTQSDLLTLTEILAKLDQTYDLGVRRGTSNAASSASVRHRSIRPEFVRAVVSSAIGGFP